MVFTILAMDHIITIWIYLSPPIATPSYTPLVERETILFNSLDIPPERET